MLYLSCDCGHHKCPINFKMTVCKRSPNDHFFMYSLDSIMFRDKKNSAVDWLDTKVTTLGSIYYVQIYNRMRTWISYWRKCSTGKDLKFIYTILQKISCWQKNIYHNYLKIFKRIAPCVSMTSLAPFQQRLCSTIWNWQYSNN